MGQIGLVRGLLVALGGLQPNARRDPNTEAGVRVSVPVGDGAGVGVAVCPVEGLRTKEFFEGVAPEASVVLFPTC